MNDKYSFLRVPLDTDKPTAPAPAPAPTPPPFAVSFSDRKARRIIAQADRHGMTTPAMTDWLCELALGILEGKETEHETLRHLSDARHRKRNRDRELQDQVQLW